MTNKQKQLLLQFLGLYTGAIDGIWGQKSQAAMDLVREKYGDDCDTVVLMEAIADWEPNVPDNNVENKSFWDEIEFFSRYEFKCTCNGRGCYGYPAEPRERLVRNADAARKHFGRPAIVSSGVRCQLRNSELPGSAANSLHLTGRAMDFSIPGVSSVELEVYCWTLPEVHECYRIDENYVHMGVEKY